MGIFFGFHLFYGKIFEKFGNLKRLYMMPDNSLTDEVLIQKYQDFGDIHSLNTLIKRYLRKTYAFFLKRLKNQDDVEDQVQNVFLNLIRIIHSGKKIKSFEDYLFITCRNTFRDYLRKKNSASLVQSSLTNNSLDALDLISFSDWLHTESVSPVSKNQLELALNGCITDFSSEKVRDILSDYVHGYALKEIGQRNHCSINTASSIWHRQKRKLWQCVLKKIKKL